MQIKLLKFYQFHLKGKMVLQKSKDSFNLKIFLSQLVKGFFVFLVSLLLFETPAFSSGVSLPKADGGTTEISLERSGSTVRRYTVPPYIADLTRDAAFNRQQAQSRQRQNLAPARPLSASTPSSSGTMMVRRAAYFVNVISRPRDNLYYVTPIAIPSMHIGPDSKIDPRSQYALGGPIPILYRSCKNQFISIPAANDLETLPWYPQATGRSASDIMEGPGVYIFVFLDHFGNLGHSAYVGEAVNLYERIIEELISLQREQYTTNAFFQGLYSNWRNNPQSVRLMILIHDSGSHLKTPEARNEEEAKVIKMLQDKEYGGLEHVQLVANLEYNSRWESLLPPVRVFAPKWNPTTYINNLIGSRFRKLIEAKKILESDIKELTGKIEVLNLKNPQPDEKILKEIKKLQDTVNKKTNTFNSKVEAIEKEANPNLTKKQSRAFGRVRTKTSMTAEEIQDYRDKWKPSRANPTWIFYKNRDYNSFS